MIINSLAQADSEPRLLVANELTLWFALENPSYSRVWNCEVILKMLLVSSLQCKALILSASFKPRSFLYHIKPPSEEENLSPCTEYDLG